MLQSGENDRNTNRQLYPSDQKTREEHPLLPGNRKFVTLLFSNELVISANFIQFMSCMFGLSHHPNGVSQGLVSHGVVRLRTIFNFCTFLYNFRLVPVSRVQANYLRFHIADYAARAPIKMVRQSPSAKSVSPGTSNQTPMRA